MISLQVRCLNPRCQHWIGEFEILGTGPARLRCGKCDGFSRFHVQDGVWIAQRFDPKETKKPIILPAQAERSQLHKH